MLIIKVGNRKIKLFNWIIFILILFLIVYIIGSIVFLIPIFSKSYKNKIKTDSYLINTKITFKNTWFSCSKKEEYVIQTNDKDIKKYLKNELIKDGFRKNKNKFIRKTKKIGFCSNEKKDYEKVISNKYVYKLNGSNNINIKYKENYNEEYVTFKINGKDSDNIIINSNLNINKVGNYVIVYKLKVNSNFNYYLFRKVNVIDSEKPVITLQGDEKIVLDYNSKYVELGFTATDNYDGDITNKVSVKNTVNEKKKGTYKVTYKVSDSSNNKDKKERIVIVKDKAISVNKEEPKIEVKDGITYVNGILIVNKKYGLPSNYNPGVNPEANSVLKKMQADASAIGLNLQLVSGFRSYERQENLYNSYVKKDGKTKADTYSAMPGHSEHQTGFAFDIGRVNRNFSNTSESKWLEENAHLYGFIIRYPKGKTSITGYIYEPWHVRYLGVDIATDVKNSGLCLEEYLGIN